LRRERYDAAISLLDDLLTRDPQYPEAESLLDAAKDAQRLADTYRLALDAEGEGDWSAARDAYATVLQSKPNYRDAAERQRECQTRQRIADLQAELRLHASAEHWQVVLDVDAELSQLDPAAADPDGLTTRAREHLRSAELELLNDQARGAEDADDRATAAPESSRDRDPRINRDELLSSFDVGSEDKAAAVALLEWAEKHPDLRVTWREAADIDVPGRVKRLLRVWPSGHWPTGDLEVRLQSLKSIDSSTWGFERRDQLIRRLEARAHLHFDNSRQWPKAPIAPLADPRKRQSFLDIIEEVVRSLNLPV
jgi:hypothetical protein